MRVLPSFAHVASWALGSALILTVPSLASAAPKSTAAFGPLATPEGITIQPLGLAQGYSLSKETATKLPREKIVYANASGMTLYVSDKDQAGQSSCVGECEKLWPPALADKDAKPVEGWSLIQRPGGERQWAVNGKPLYTFSLDADVGSVGGNSPKRFGRGDAVGPRGRTSASIAKDKPLPEGWHEAVMYPVSNVSLPGGFSIRDVEDAMAMVIVSEVSGRTLYVFDGGPEKAEKACSSISCRDQWIPLIAPRAAAAYGEFSAKERMDGVRQWTFKGRALYTFAGDLGFGDANGIGVDKRWEAAAVARYWMPSEVTVQVTPKLGKVLATAQGKTLYRRNSYILQSGGGHSLRRGDPIRPAVGRDLGADPRCETDCDKWHPLLAPRTAHAWGDWNIVARPDGSKQWTHRGYALWSYDGDKLPGDINGNDSFRLVMSHDSSRLVADIGTPTDGLSALYWIAANP